MTAQPPEIYLVVDNARSQALTRAWDRFDDTAIASVDLYFRARTEVALVAVHLRPGHDRARWIGQVVASGVAVIDPARMGEGDRRAFFASYLQSYVMLARGGATIAAVMAALRSAAGGDEVMVVADEASSGSGGPTVEYRARDTEPVAEPAPLPPPPAPPPPAVQARFLRGGQWSPARLRSLSARGAYLVTGAPPRIGDEVHVALELGNLSLIVRGGVYHVTTARDAAETGSSGFAVRFPAENRAARERLVELLTEARARGVVIKPPPSRQAVRFPVRWPVELRGDDGTYGDVLDVSTGGLFVSPQAPLRERIVTALVPVEAGEAPVELRARVARAVTSADASARGLAAGYGLEIVEMSAADRARWQRFLARVERRSAKSVLVGAAPRRLEQIGRALADAGYAVTSSADPGALVRLADGPSMPDVAVIDESLLEQGVSATWLEQMFTQRQVPCITIRGEAVRARLVVDRLLAVAA